MTAVSPIPKGFHSVTPYLTIKGVKKAIEWYKTALGAVEGRMLQDTRGVIVYAEIQILDSYVMLCDEDPMFGTKGPEARGGSPVMLHLYTDDADALFARAVGAGATVQKALETQFQGDRSGFVKDPFGYTWVIAQRVEEVSDATLATRWASIAQQMAAHSRT